VTAFPGRPLQVNTELAQNSARVEWALSIEFDQFYRSVRYSDWGPKILKVKLLPSGEKIVYEELIASHPL
jgi:hypothetical protein